MAEEVLTSYSLNKIAIAIEAKVDQLDREIAQEQQAIPDGR